jgi:citrate lyase subunit beta/citryl-CoA lyase
VDERLRRSLLYVPASAEAMVRKAGTRGADVVILDLEDGVLPEAKEPARRQAERLAAEVDFGDSEVLLRVNAPGTSWHGDDLEAANRMRPDGVVLPKTEARGAVEAVARHLHDRPLYLAIETARGVLAAAELARVAHVRGLLFGAADFRESVRARRQADESEILLARESLVLAARAARVLVFDTPFFDYRDEGGLATSAARARGLGFDGKTAIHPAQVPILNRVFSPTPAEIERARKVVDALEAAARDGRAVATVEGEMVEAVHLADARRTLSWAEQAARR